MQLFSLVREVFDERIAFDANRKSNFLFANAFFINYGWIDFYCVFIKNSISNNFQF